MMELDGLIKTQIRVRVRLIDIDDEGHYFKLHFTKEQYQLVKAMLDTGAGVWFGLQKSQSEQKNDTDGKEHST